MNSLPNCLRIKLETERKRRSQEASKAEVRLSFRDFVAKVAPKYVWYKHCSELAMVLQRVADGEITRLMVFMPPRHGKSELVSRLFAAYYLYIYPNRWVGQNSFSSELSLTLARAAHENFVRAGGVFKEASSAVKHAETLKNGGMWAAGVGGSITGKGFHLGIIDDPLKNFEEANSEVIREKIKWWYSSTFGTREEPGGAVIVIQTRWHEDDLSGWLLANEAGEAPEHWYIVSLPALAEEPPEFPATCTVHEDWREQGEALCPDRYSVSLLEKKRRENEVVFTGLYQQRPSALEGTMFKVGRLEIVSAAPAELHRCRAWDLAASAGKGDFTAGVLMGRDSAGIYYILDVFREQAGSDLVKASILQAARLDGVRVGIHLPQDPGQAGKDQANQLVRMLAGFNVKAESVSGAKVTRWFGFSAQVNAGNVKLVAGGWNRAFVEELRQAPGGKYDDQLDAAADAFNEVALGLREADAF